MYSTVGVPLIWALSPIWDMFVIQKPCPISPEPICQTLGQPWQLAMKTKSFMKERALGNLELPDNFAIAWRAFQEIWFCNSGSVPQNPNKAFDVASRVTCCYFWEIREKVQRSFQELSYLRSILENRQLLDFETPQFRMLWQNQIKFNFMSQIACILGENCFCISIRIIELRRIFFLWAHLKSARGVKGFLFFHRTSSQHQDYYQKALFKLFFLFPSSCSYPVCQGNFLFARWKINPQLSKDEKRRA